MNRHILKGCADRIYAKISYAVADLRHLYDHMVNGNVGDIKQAAKLVATGIKQLEELQSLTSDLKLLRDDEIDTDREQRALLEVIAMNAPRLVLLRAGDKAMMGWFVGHTLKHTEGRTNPVIIHRLLLDLMALPGWPQFEGGEGGGDVDKDPSQG